MRLDKSLPVLGHGKRQQIVIMAAAKGKRVAVHSYGPEAVPDAIRAGVHSIEHAVGMNDELLSAWAESLGGAVQHGASTLPPSAC